MRVSIQYQRIRSHPFKRENHPTANMQLPMSKEAKRRFSACVVFNFFSNHLALFSLILAPYLPLAPDSVCTLSNFDALALSRFNGCSRLCSVLCVNALTLTQNL